MRRFGSSFFLGKPRRFGGGLLFGNAGGLGFSLAL
jgi:hypothetical protein